MKLELAGLDLGEVEDLVDQGQQVRAGVVDPSSGSTSWLLAALLGLLLEHLGDADDGVQRRPELVAHVGEELALRPGRRHGLVSGKFELRGVALDLA